MCTDDDCTIRQIGYSKAQIRTGGRRPCQVIASSSFTAVYRASDVVFERTDFQQ